MNAQSFVGAAVMLALTLPIVLVWYRMMHRKLRQARIAAAHAQVESVRLFEEQFRPQIFRAQHDEPVRGRLVNPRHLQEKAFGIMAEQLLVGLREHGALELMEIDVQASGTRHFEMRLGALVPIDKTRRVITPL